MAQSYSLGALGQFLTVNGASNTATFANAISVGNASVNTTINSTAFTGQANNALYLGGTIASGYLTTAGVNANIAAYLPTYTGVVNASLYTISTTFIANTTGVYHTGVVNAASHTVGTSTIANATGVYTGVVNGASHTVGSIFVANATAVTINTIPITYGTTGTAAPTLTTRSTGTKIVLYDSLSGSSVDYAIGVESGYQWQSWPSTTQGLKWYSGTSQVMLANTTGFYYTGTANASSFTVGSSFIANTTGAYHTGLVNAASYAVGLSFIANTSQVTVTTPLSANASTGTAGYVLTSNGATGSPYWAAASAGVNVAAQYVWTNTHTFSNSVIYTNAQQVKFQTVNTSVYAYFTQQNDDNFVFYSSNTIGGARPVWAIYANSATSNLDIIVRARMSGGMVIPPGATILDSTGSQGAAGYVLTSNGAGNVYWTSAGAASVDQTAAYNWTNTHTFNANVTLVGGLIANGSVGTAGYVLTSNGSTGSPYWAAGGGGGGSFTNGASIAVSNLAFTNTTNTSVGVAYSFINTTSNSLDTVFA